MKKILLTTVLAALGSAAALSGSASAADLGARPYTKAPAMMAAVTNWSGLYVGGNVGYGWGNGNTDFSFLPTPALFNVQNATLDNKPKGVIGGAQIGYNWQVGSVVTGFEADIQGSGIKGSASAPSISVLTGLPVAGDFLLAEQKLSWFGTVRARLGVTVTPDLLLYGTGGLAYGHVDHSANWFDGATNQAPVSIGKTKIGWSAGAGSEWMFARNWSAKIEYLYVDLGKDSAIGDFTPVDPVFKVGYTWHTQDHIVRAGVNYHF